MRVRVRLKVRVRVRVKVRVRVRVRVVAWGPRRGARVARDVVDPRDAAQLDGLLVRGRGLLELTRAVVAGRVGVHGFSV